MQRAPLPLALAAIILLAGCTYVPAASSAGGEPSASAGVQPSAPPSPEQSLLGRRGSVAWLTTPQGLSLSSDSGRTFAQVPLPSRVSPAAIIAVTAIAGTTWLASGGPGRSITVYARDTAAGSWSPGAQLTPTWPTNLGGAEAEPPSAVWIAPGGPRQVLVMTQLVLSHSVSIPRLFVSGDGGVTFAQRVQPTVNDLNTPWDSIAMSGTAAIAVIGNRSNEVIHSGDTGSTWDPSRVGGIAPGTDFVVGTAVFAGATVYLPVTDVDAGGFVLQRSTDGGAVFEPLGAQTVSLGTLGGPPPVAAAGAAWWLVSPMTGTVFRSADSGLTWSKAVAALPQGVVGIAATDGQNATVTIEQSACAAGKTACTSSMYSEATSDGGQTWTRI